MSLSSPSSAVPSQTRRRQSSAATPAQEISFMPSRTGSRPQSPSLLAPVSARRSPYYTLFIRLPFARGDFEDPHPVNWNSARDRQLWRLISKASSADLDWEALSHEFDVDLSFLLIQAAWLSERHMERMRRQLGRLGGVVTGEKGEGSGSGLAGGSTGGVRMERTGSRDSKLQTASTATAVRMGSPAYPSPLEVGGSSGTGTPRSGHPPISRTPSSATVTQSRFSPSAAKQAQQTPRAVHTSSGSGRRPPAFSTSVPSSPRDAYLDDAIEHEGPSASDDSEEEPSAMARSQAFRRPPMGKKVKPTLGTVGSDGDGEGGEDEDDDDSPGGYLPFAAASKPDPAATLKGNLSKTSATNSSASKFPSKSKDFSTRVATADSSASSASSAMHRQLSGTDSDNPLATQRRPGPLSPTHRAQLASLSPRFRSSKGKDGSEGSPSMGSSFSDLDVDASVTQSALEEALMSNMRGQGSGGSTMASRVSSLRDALGRK